MTSFQFDTGSTVCSVSLCVIHLISHPAPTAVPSSRYIRYTLRPDNKRDYADIISIMYVSTSRSTSARIESALEKDDDTARREGNEISSLQAARRDFAEKSNATKDQIIVAGLRLKVKNDSPLVIPQRPENIPTVAPGSHDSDIITFYPATTFDFSIGSGIYAGTLENVCGKSVRE